MLEQLALEWLTVIYAESHGEPMLRNVPLSIIGCNLSDLDYWKALKDLVDFALIERARDGYVWLTEAGAPS